MEIDFSAIIRSRTELLEERITQLRNVINDLTIEGPFQFSIAEIVPEEEYHSNKKVLKIGVPQLNFIENLKGSYLYFFELDKKTNKETLIASIREKQNETKGSAEKIALPKIPISYDQELSDILYVGSTKSSFYKRIKEHVGFGSKATYALHLRHWAPKDLKLNFYYVKIENSDIRYDIEAALATYLNPLLGKREK